MGLRRSIFESGCLSFRTFASTRVCFGYCPHSVTVKQYFCCEYKKLLALALCSFNSRLFVGRGCAQDVFERRCIVTGNWRGIWQVVYHVKGAWQQGYGRRFQIQGSTLAVFRGNRLSFGVWGNYTPKLTRKRKKGSYKDYFPSIGHHVASVLVWQLFGRG